jgi:hypothetical protein
MTTGARGAFRTMDSQLSEEFDTGVEQDEILARGGMYAVGTVPGTTWKALVVIGAVVAVFGVLLELMVRGWIYPIPDYFPTPLGSGLVLAVPVAGLLILLSGLAVRARARREPPIEPIV